MADTICGKLSENYVHIFKTEGLKNKIETCLPIIVSPLCLLPDTICSECLENVDNFYSFIKNCLQNIIVLEAQYDITESCLKTKRKHEKGCTTTDLSPTHYDKNIQTDEDFSELLLQKDDFTSGTFHFNCLELEKLDAALLNAENILNGKEPEARNAGAQDKSALVNYEMDSDSEIEDHTSTGKVVLVPKIHKSKPHKMQLSKTNVECRPPSAISSRRYFDDPENDLISEIARRKDLKRKNDTILTRRTKIFKMDTYSKRKSRQPKKVKQYTNECGRLNFDNLELICKEVVEESDVTKMPLPFVSADRLHEYTEEDKFAAMQQVEKEISGSLPQLCLLCDSQFPGPTMLAAHVYEMHGIDMAQVLSSEPVMERKKKIPNLVKITNLKAKADAPDAAREQQPCEDPPTLQPTFVCPVCPAVLTNRSDLFAHLKAKHGKQAANTCGLCLHMAGSYANLALHLETCRRHHSHVASRYICKVCSYHDDNPKTMENHVAVHDFVLALCKKQARMFDPCDYTAVNPACEAATKTFACTECGQGGFATFREFSTHRRSQHQIFHCDLCNKFYGRNSHLWKHVNRLHKGHPSITCQLCYKTSASKYHLAQHFNKIHTVKPFKQRQSDSAVGAAVANDEAPESFMTQKFQGFDFQSVRQSFMRQELIEQEQKATASAAPRPSDEAGGNNTDGEECRTVPKLNIKVEVKAEPSPPDLDCSDAETYPDDCNTEAGDTADSGPKRRRGPASAPKEIDASSDLYTNIITNYTPPQNEGEYKCPKCLKGFHKKTLVKKHKKNCRPRLQKDLLTRCKTCARIFKDRQSLAKHLVNYHSEYTCEICGQKVQSKCEIVSHIRFSHPSCHLFCHCGQILRSERDLAEHRRDHRNSFACQFCGDALPTKIKLKMHILSLHRKILSLSCGICLRLFETQHILRDHVRLAHGPELAPFTSCTVCGKNYGSKWKTYDHLNKSHGRIFKACKACLDVFDTEGELQAHFETAHVGASQFRGGGTAASLATATAAGLHVKKDPAAAYESDEHARDENEDKNSSSDFSNEDSPPRYEAKEMMPNNPSEEEDEEEQQQQLLHEPRTNNEFEVAGQENRISLLEKRLLGSAKMLCDSNFATGFPFRNKNNNQTSAVALQQHPKKNKPEAVPHDIQNQPQKKSRANEGDAEPNSQHNPLQNSSKRTVYVNSNDPSLCEICLKTWPAKKHLWQHYIRCHKTVAATVCGICLKTNDGYGPLQAHLRQTHPTLLHGQGFGSNFICRICGRYHNASSKLKLHMAIHENFDWAALAEGRVRGPEGDEHGAEGAPDNNGYADGPEGEEGGGRAPDEPPSALYPNHRSGGGGGNNINYESLIEQVECSTDSDSELDDCLKEEGEGEEEGSGSKCAANHETMMNSSSGGGGDEEEEEEEEDSDNESAVSASEENSLESRMLQNMLKEKFTDKGCGGGEDYDFSGRLSPAPKPEYSSSDEDSDDSSDSNQSVSDMEVEVLEEVAVDGEEEEEEDVIQIRSNSEEEEDEEGEDGPGPEGDEGEESAAAAAEEDNVNMFMRKPEELDSAIRSISYEQVDDVDERMDVDMCDVQPQHTLNQHEIQSAVDSIL